MKTINELSKEFSQNKQRSRKCPFEFFIEEIDGNKKMSTRQIEDQDDRLQILTGTPNETVSLSIINSAVMALPNSLESAEKRNLVFQSLTDSMPQDAHEARLSAQATVLYAQGMDFLERARRVLFDDGTFAKDHWHTILMKTATKLLDLHTKTLEALTRYRSHGEQRIVVQHVTVENGGKAIVGNLMTGGGGSDNK